MPSLLDDLLDLLARAGLDRQSLERLDPGAPLAAQGVDSITHPIFILAVEDRFGVRIDQEQALALRTLDDFLALLAAKGIGDGR